MRLNREQKKAVSEFTKKLVEQEKQKEFLLNQKSDWGFLEQLIQRANDNPGLRVEVTLNDGTKLALSTFKPNRKRDLIEESFDYDGV